MRNEYESLKLELGDMYLGEKVLSDWGTDSLAFTPILGCGHFLTISAECRFDHKPCG